jgi:hypothetical protein
MAGQSGKKDVKKRASNRLIWKALILIVTALYVIINAYSVVFNEGKFTRGDTIGFMILTIVNLALYRLLDMTMESYFFLYLVDLLIINLSVMVLINFHWKFWFLYLVVPGYFLVKASKYVYEHVKTVGKSDPNEEPVDPRAAKGKSNSGKEKEKRQIIRN